MVEELSSRIPPVLLERTEFNRSATVSMDIIPDAEPGRFSDLSALCVRLIRAAGRRSHFEGLLMLNISAFTRSADDIPRLKALGELLALRNGPASECRTLLYGPEKERDVLFIADHLDFDGRLKVIGYERPGPSSLTELLSEAELRCATAGAEHQLEAVLQDMAGYRRFNADKFIRICGNDRGVITEDDVFSALNDPYSYINRVKKAAEPDHSDPADRRIGFHTAHQLR